MDTKSLLNMVTVPSGNLRRNIVQLVDKITIATGKTVYPIFSGSITQFVRNLSLPISGDTIYALTNLKLISETLFTSTVDLIELLQKSYLEIIVSQKQQIKLPLFKVLNFYKSDTIGASPVKANFNISLVGKSKNLIYPIILGQSQNVIVNLVITSTAATDLNNGIIDVEFDAIQSTVLDPAFYYAPQSGNIFQDIDYTLWNSIAIGTANQTTFSLFSDNTLAQNLLSQNLPLPSDQRFELQNIEFLFVSNNVASQAETLQKIFNNRSHNYLTISVNQTILHQSDLSEDINIVTQYDNVPFNDNAGTPVTTNLGTFETLFQSKTLKVPVIFPATGLVTVTLDQPSSSLNNGELFTVAFNGSLKRTVN